MSGNHLITPQATTENVKADVYYFSHIPKTGGTSFTAILERFFDSSEIFKPQLWWDVGEIDKARACDFHLIRGHFGMAARALSGQQLKVLTILRNPLRMAYSTYQYVKREPNTGKRRYVIENNLTFEDFLQDPHT